MRERAGAAAERRTRRRRALLAASRCDLDGLPQRGRLAGLRRAATTQPLTFERAAVRPSALHPVFVRHDRRAEMHRARRRRHAAAAPEGASCCTRDIKRGDRVFYFTTCGWMMWNWLVSGLASARRCCSTTARPSIPTATSLFDLADDERHDAVRHLARSTSTRSRRPASSRARRTTSPRCARSSRPARRSRRRASTTSTRREGRRAASPRSPAAPTSSRCFVLGNPTAAGVARRDPVPRPRHGGRGLRRRRPAGARREGRARLHRAVPVDAGRFLERSRRREIPRRLFRALPERLVPRRLRRADRRTAASSSTAAPTRRSIPAACASARPRSTARSSRCRGRSRRIVIGQDWDDDVRVVLFVRLRDGAGARRRAARAHPEADPRTTPRRATCRRRSSQVADIPRTKSGKIIELAVRDIVHGRAVKNNEALANPEALECFRGLAALER